MYLGGGYFHCRSFIHCVGCRTLTSYEHSNLDVPGKQFDYFVYNYSGSLINLEPYAF